MALTFWVVAAIFILGDVPLSLMIKDAARRVQESAAEVNSFTLISIWQESRAALLQGGQLIGIGVLIELVDQIRWNALPAEMRIPRRPIVKAFGRLRSAGLS